MLSAHWPKETLTPYTIHHHAASHQHSPVEVFLWSTRHVSAFSHVTYFPSLCVAGEEESLRLPVGHGGAGVRGADGRRLHHHRVRKQHEQQRLRHRHAARQPLQRPVLPEVSDSRRRRARQGA